MTILVQTLWARWVEPGGPCRGSVAASDGAAANSLGSGVAGSTDQSYLPGAEVVGFMGAEDAAWSDFASMHFLGSTMTSVATVRNGQGDGAGATSMDCEAAEVAEGADQDYAGGRECSTGQCGDERGMQQRRRVIMQRRAGDKEIRR